jgi:hypothetical protein
MKFKLVEYPYGREIGFNQNTVWFIQGTTDNKTWNNYIWSYTDCSPSIILEKESVSRTCPPMSAFLTNEEANEAFDKITNYYKDVKEGKNISILREVEI